jgi:hypothetical protein
MLRSDISGGGGGLLKPAQSNRFLDYLYEQSVLVRDARFIRMNNPTMEIDKVSVGTRLLKKATEATDDGVNKVPTFTKISLTTVKLRLDWEMSTEGLEDNIEGDSLEDHVASLMARQTANDLEDLYIHGDTTSANALLVALDGFRKIARARGHVVDAAGANLTRSIFDRALRNLPNKYLQRRNALRWYTSSSLLQDYLWSLTLDVAATGASSPGSTFGDSIVNAGFSGAQGGAAGLAGVRPFGIGLLEVPLMEETEAGDYTNASGNHGVVELTFPDNRIVGVQRDIVVYREFKPKKDTIEFTLYTRVANQIEDENSYVHVKNVKVRSL